MAEFEEVNGERISSHGQPASERRLSNAPWKLFYERGSTFHDAEYTNFGSDGTAFVFIDRTQTPPVVRWLWNR